jgi:hypothetical protein
MTQTSACVGPVPGDWNAMDRPSGLTLRKRTHILFGPEAGGVEKALAVSCPNGAVAEPKTSVYFGDRNDIAYLNINLIERPTAFRQNAALPMRSFSVWRVSSIEGAESGDVAIHCGYLSIDRGIKI